jgi:hypothetical protein
MIVRKADEVDPWTAEKAMANYYRPNSVVWYQKDEKSQGWIYRAKSDYVKSKTPPDEDDKWARDYSFYLPWKPSNKYEIGMRVYFFNGQRLYGYIASRRYFGGTGEPNSEVDDDGVRTWEIDFEYNAYQYYQALPTEFLFPVKKRIGYIDGKVNALSPTDSEERPTTYEVQIPDGIWIEAYGYLVGHLTQEGILSKDYSEYNSKYQSYAYDDETYIFYKETNNGSSVEHRKAGLHRAKFLKELNPQDPRFKHAESQFVWTYRYNFWFYYGSYFNPHGFSIEIWPNAAEDDYEFIPSYGFKSFGVFSLGVNGSGSFTMPSFTLGIVFNLYDYVSYFYSGIGMSGGFGDPAPDGGSYPATPNEELKFDAYFGRNCPAFDGRVGTINLLKEDEYWQWVDKGYWTSDCYDCPVYWVEYWQLERIGYKDENYKPTYSFVEETVDSYEESYKWGGSGLFLESSGKVRDKQEKPIDLNKYKSFLTTSYISWFGSKWE